MVGPISVKVKSNFVSYEFTLNRKVTLLRGDSGTGKTTLAWLVSNSDNISSVRVICNYDVQAFTSKEKNALVDVLVKIENSVVIIDENWVEFLTEKFLAKIIKESSNYFLLITRKKFSMIPISVLEVYKIKSVGSVNRFENIYPINSVGDGSLVPDVVITEDSGAGYKLFKYMCNGSENCVSAGGRSNIKGMVTNPEYFDKVKLVIVDGASFGCDFADLIKLRLKHKNLLVYVIESFEFLMLQLQIVRKLGNVDKILDNPIKYISVDYFSWEHYFYDLLTSVTKFTDFKYSKGRLPKCFIKNCCYRGNKCKCFSRTDRYAELSFLLSECDFSKIRGEK
jgi:hypothetical protein